MMAHMAIPLDQVYADTEMVHLHYVAKVRRRRLEPCSRQLNAERWKRSITTRLFPLGREEVISYYNDPLNVISPHKVPSITSPMRSHGILGVAVESSSKNMKDLKVIGLDEMRCHKRHDGALIPKVELTSGRYLLCRVITKPSVGLGITM